MRIRSVGAALLAGGATAFVVFVAVSEALLDEIEFSVFVGIPAGLVAGALVTALVLYVRRDDRSPSLARAAGAFGVALLSVVALGITAGAGVLATTGGAVLVGLLVGLGVYLRAHQPTQ
jgi:peptidoglycan/LPS O-acetylase OafA/YrhL